MDLLEELREFVLQEMRHKRVKISPSVRRARRLKYKRNRKIILRKKARYKKTMPYKKWKIKFKRKTARPSYIQKHYY